MKQLGTILILGLLSLFLVRGAAAQETPELASLSIALWPEFDRPDMLVIYQGALTPETPLPAAMEIRIPARVGQPSAVAFLSETGDRLNQQYTTRAEGEVLVVSFQLTSRSFQLEYYDDLPISAEGQREYVFAYTADYDTGELTVELQVPPTAEDLEVEPEAGNDETGADGLLYRRIAVGTVAAGDTVGWTFRYTKDNDELTNPPASQPGQITTQPAASGGTDGGGSNWVVTFFVAFVALLAVGGAAFWLGRSTRATASQVPPGRVRPGPASQPPAGDVAFCYRCGAELRSDADFCHKCGAPARS